MFYMYIVVLFLTDLGIHAYTVWGLCGFGSLVFGFAFRIY